MADTVNLNGFVDRYFTMTNRNSIQCNEITYTKTDIPISMKDGKLRTLHLVVRLVIDMAQPVLADVEIHYFDCPDVIILDSIQLDAGINELSAISIDTPLPCLRAHPIIIIKQHNAPQEILTPLRIIATGISAHEDNNLMKLLYDSRMVYVQLTDKCKITIEREKVTITQTNN